MKRKTIFFLAFRLLIAGLLLITFSFAQVRELPMPNARQVAWQQAELGVLISYDLHVFDPSRYNQSLNRVTPIADYNIFNPGQLDVEQWIRAVKAAGAKFAILTVTHETGFALYQSDVNPYCMKALKWRDGKGDLVLDFVNACHKYNIKPGLFLGIRWNSFFGVHDFKVVGSGETQKQRQLYYNAMVEGMVKELCTKYGELFEVWFDGGASSPEKGAPDVLPIVKKYQPNCLFYHNEQLAEARWGGSENGIVGYPCWSTFPYPATGAGESAKKEISANNFALSKTGDPDGKYWVPAMADAPLRGYNGRHEWFWEPGDEEHIFPLNDLMDMYYKSVGRNATLILGLTPDARGLLPDPDVKRLEELGTAIKKKFSSPMASTAGKGYQLDINLPKAMAVNQIVLQEEISNGQRVRIFNVQALVKGKWQKIIEASSIGNKYINLLDKPVIAKKIRLQVEKSIGEPEIKNFAVYTAEH